MSDVSSIGVAVVNTANPNTSPSSANSGRGASGNDLPLAPVLAKPSTAEQSREVLEKTRESLASAVEKMNEYVRSTQRDLQFSYDERSEEHTSELQSRGHLVCRLLLEKKKHTTIN